MSRRHSPFATVRTEGAILPADLLERVAAGDRSLGGLAPTDYGLAPGETLGEAASRSWNRLLGLWRSFRTAAEALPAGDHGTGVTRDRWLLPLFQELGYERLPVHRATEIEGKSYPISHMREGLPVHLVGVRVDLDARTTGVAGAARASPHSLVQEFLNRSEGHLWGFVSNGLRLRILRDNASLTRQAYVELDLEAMLDGEAFADFSLLWLVCHRTRTEAERPEDCWLERWSKTAQAEGARALERLRDGVERAIEALGQGFLAHPANAALREALRSGALSTQDYYRQLLRLVYRLVFLFAAEDRELLFAPTADPAARERYLRHYSSRRLRDLAGRIRGTRHPDLYEAFKLVARLLGGHGDAAALALTPLGSFLWSWAAVPSLDGRLANRELLEAVRLLAWRESEGRLRPVDYKNLRGEELGSVYEALLELQPELNVDAGTFALRTVGGHERKTSGSFYTPDSLVQALLDSALEPVVAERLRRAGELASGERGVASSTWGMEAKRYVYRVLSGSGDLAAGHGAGGAGVWGHSRFPERGVVRPDQSTTAGGGLRSGEHRGGLGSEGSAGLPSLSAHRSGESEGTRNAPPLEHPGGRVQLGRGPADAVRGSGPREATPGDAAESDLDRRLNALYRAIPLATRYSLLAEHALLSLRVCDPADVHGPDYPSETFRVLKNREMKELGEYRTRRLVLESFDRLGQPAGPSSRTAPADLQIR